jgi:hypothetical protein
MKRCYICKEIIWFWQKDLYKLVEIDNGDKLGKYFHEKCYDSCYGIRTKDLVT